MKLGDPKRATMLGIVAVGAIGFMVIQMAPSGSTGPGAVATPAEESEGSGGGTIAPAALMTDPFSHAVQQAQDAAEKANKRTEEIMAMEREASGFGSMPGSGFGGSEPGQQGNTPVFPSGPNGAPLPGVMATATPEPVKTAGFFQQFNQADAVEVTVQGFMKLKSPKAFISVEGEPARAIGIGEEFAKGLKLVDILENAIVVSRPGISFKVEVGGSMRI